MFGNFQLLTPGMHPLVFAMLFFVVLGCFFAGIAGLCFGLSKKLRFSKRYRYAVCMVSVLLLLFSCGNWMACEIRFREQESKITGVFIGENRTRCEVFPDGYWKCTSRRLPCHEGTWKYVASEDWAYWEFSSDLSGHCFFQTGNPHVLDFGEGRVFTRKKK